MGEKKSLQGNKYPLSSSLKTTCKGTCRCISLFLLTEYSLHHARGNLRGDAIILLSHFFLSKEIMPKLTNLNFTQIGDDPHNFVSDEMITIPKGSRFLVISNFNTSKSISQTYSSQMMILVSCAGIEPGVIELGDHRSLSLEILVQSPADITREWLHIRFVSMHNPNILITGDWGFSYEFSEIRPLRQSLSPHVGLPSSERKVQSSTKVNPSPSTSRVSKRLSIAAVFTGGLIGALILARKG